MGISLKQRIVVINPTNDFLPKRSNATTFTDSLLKQTGVDEPVLETEFSGRLFGIKVNTFNNNIVASIGDYNGLVNETCIVVDDEAGIIALHGTSIIDSPGVVVPSANFLRLTINGINYLISLST